MLSAQQMQFIIVPVVVQTKRNAIKVCISQIFKLFRLLYRMFKQSNSFTKLINEASNEISPVLLQARTELCSMIYYKEFVT